MFDHINHWLRTLPEQLRQLPPLQRFALLGVPAALLAVLVVMVTLWRAGEKEQQQVLYSQLNMQDAGAIAAKLKEMKVPYTLRGDGTTILVPAAMVLDARLRLATEGLPQGGGVGYEVFGNSPLGGMTDFMQKLNYRRALQGELARTIGRIAAVHSARVHLVIPEKALFREQQEKTTASVALTLVPGRRLTSEQIRGITQLIASSVPGLDPLDVVIVDDTGQLLRKDERTNSLTQPEAQLAHQRAQESDLERKVQTLLEPAVGKGKVQARVSVTLDFQQLERTEERFDADNPAIRSQQRVKEEGTGTGFWAMGTPGVRTNVPEGVPSGVTPGAGDKNTASRQTEMINNELSKTTTRVVAPTGEIKKLSVAVLVDGTYQVGAKGERQYVPRSAEELAKYREIVKSAVGFNESRGDRVDVADAHFDTPDEPEAALQGEARRVFWIKLSGYGAYVILGLLFCLFIARPLIQMLSGRAAETVVETMLPRTVQELEAGMETPGLLPGTEDAVAGHLPAGTEPARPRRPTGNPLRTRVIELAKQDPEHAAEILRMWLKRG
jgi:flagellar M-ring protein FliF